MTTLNQNTPHHTRSAEAFIGLGANLLKPQQQLESALKQLKQIPEISVQSCSSFYRSAPIGPQDQNDFINAVASVHTSLSPLQLLRHCQRIENTHGRVRNGNRWGPRILDLDLLLYRSMSDTANAPWLQLSTPELSLPHPEILNRAFVVLPLLEIQPDVEIAFGIPLESYRAKLSHQTLVQLICPH